MQLPPFPQHVDLQLCYASILILVTTLLLGIALSHPQDIVDRSNFGSSGLQLGDTQSAAMSQLNEYIEKLLGRHWEFLLCNAFYSNGPTALGSMTQRVNQMKLGAIYEQGGLTQ